MFKILLVDDSATDRRLIEGLLKKSLHFEVDTAADGLKALESLKAKVPDVVVTDMQMPNMDGMQLVENVRKLYPLVPVVLITAAGSEELASEALKRGAAGYVPKARCGELLNETLDHVLELTRKKVPAVVRRHLPRHLDSSLVTSFAREQDQFGTRLSDQIAPLDAGTL